MLGVTQLPSAAAATAQCMSHAHSAVQPLLKGSLCIAQPTC